MSCADQTRRSPLLTALATGACLAAAKSAAAEGDKPGADVRPQNNSEFDPRQGAQVVFGPAPRRPAALPLESADGSLTVAATFVGKVGAPQRG